jgi:hypothetical protein
MKQCCQIPRLQLIVVIVFPILLQSLNVTGQYRRDWKTRIDNIVETADSLSLQSQIMFYAERLLRNKQVIKETWHYTLKDDKVIIFQVRYLLHGSEITEVYYVDNNELVCMERIEAPNAAEYIDEVQRGELFFLERNSLRQYVSYGRKQAVLPYGTAEYSCLRSFEDRYKELRRNMQIVRATRTKS